MAHMHDDVEKSGLDLYFSASLSDQLSLVTIHHQYSLLLLLLFIGSLRLQLDSLDNGNCRCMTR